MLATAYYICIMQQEYEILKNIIRKRRTTKAAAMNGKRIADEQIAELLELADWAPTHGRTEPWRFFVYRGEALAQFGAAHAAMYLANTPPKQQKPDTAQKLEAAPEKSSHLIAVALKPGSNPKIPLIEEIAAASAAIQNLLLAAEAAGLAAIWNTGGMSHHPAMKQFLGLESQDIVLGLIYMGYTDEPERAGKRSIPLPDKITWV
jgi:nitroreductase